MTTQSKWDKNDVWLKIRFEGRYWKIAWVMNLAKFLRLHAVYFSGGTGQPE